MIKKLKNVVSISDIAAFIVDKRKAIYLIYAILVVFSLFSSGWVKVDNDLTDYLSDDTETRQGLSVMDKEFITYATAEVMIDNISYDDAEKLADELEEVDGVKEIAFDETDKHYVNASALFSVTFSGDVDDPICQTALDNITDEVRDYDAYISAELGDTKAKRTAEEVNIVMIIACFVILGVLLFTSRTYMEIPVLIITFGVAALLNKGSNFMFGTISFVSDSVAVVLQLALAIDYAIILCHRYTEERESHDAKQAVVLALSKAMPEISGSCLTTLSGLAAMGFMQYKIGFDMSIVLIKAIILSIVTVFALMPGLLFSFSKLIDSTHHKNFVPSIKIWSNEIVKLRFVAPAIFVVISIIGIYLSNICPYSYSYTNITALRKNDSQIAQEMIKENFSPANILAVLVPSGDYKKEQDLKHELEEFPEVGSITGLASADAIDGYEVGDKLSPREFSELTDIDIEAVRVLYSAYAANDDDYGKIIGGIDNYRIALLDMFNFAYDITDEGYISLDEDTQERLDDMHEKLSDGREQLEGDNYTRLVLDLNVSEESEETYALLEKVRDTAHKYYDDVLLSGNSTNNRDLATAFVRDNILISILSILLVLLVLLFTFKSVSIPLILIMVIQGSIWINFSFPAIENKPLFFLSYLVVSAIQMGANIDYAIVITNRYVELRKKMDRFTAVKEALEQSFPTIFTSGSILASAGAIVGLVTTEPAICSIGVCLGRGTIISLILVMGVLPQLLLLFDKVIEKTFFGVKEGAVYDEEE